MEKNPNVRYLILFIVSLVIMYLGASVYIFLVYIPFGGKDGISFTEFVSSFEVLQNYFSLEIKEGNTTWHDFALNYFSNIKRFEDTKLAFTLLQIISYLPLLIIFVFFLRKDFIEDYNLFKREAKNNFKIIGITVLSMFGLSVFVGLIYQTLGIEGDSANEMLINLVFDSKGAAFMFISVAFLASIVEEVIFRKLIFKACTDTFRTSPVVPIIVSTLVFSLIHVSDLQSLKFIFMYIALALPICLAYHFSKGNIYVCIIIHMINNTISAISVL